MSNTWGTANQPPQQPGHGWGGSPPGASWGGATAPQGAPAPAHQAQPSATSAAARKVRRIVVSPILMLLSAILVPASGLMPWYLQHRVTSTNSGISVGDGVYYNAWEQAAVVTENNPGMGGMMVAALGLAGVAAVVTLVAAVLALILGAKGWLTGIAWAGVGLGLLATISLGIGMVAIGGAEHLGYGVAVFALAFVPALVGAIGLTSKKF